MLEAADHLKSLMKARAIMGHRVTSKNVKQVPPRVKGQLNPGPCDGMVQAATNKLQEAQKEHLKCNTGPDNSFCIDHKS